MTVPDLPGCVADGETVDAAIAEAHDAFELWQGGQGRNSWTRRVAGAQELGPAAGDTHRSGRRALEPVGSDLSRPRLAEGSGLREVWFVMEHKVRAIEDRFNIELRIPEDYPKTPPNAYETGDRLNGYHHLFTDGRLCLGAPVEVCKQFAMQPTLLSFVEELVVPFLFSFSYERQYGEMPFGELAHGGEGLLDYYVDFFRTSEEKTISLLIYVAVDNRNRHGSCPCGSGRRLENCHGPSSRSNAPYC